MNVGFIGAGKVGCSFGKYFQEHKIQVTGFYSKSEDSSLAASNFTSSKQYLNLRELVDENDTIFITTPDGQIQEVWQEIKNYQIKNKLICHCSGAISSDIFSNIQDYGAYGYSVHPMFSISDKYNSYKKLKKIIYAFLTIFLYLLKCPQSLNLSALRAFCFCGKPHISRSIFLYFRYQTWLKSW